MREPPLRRFVRIFLPVEVVLVPLVNTSMFAFPRKSIVYHMSLAARAQRWIATRWIAAVYFKIPLHGLLRFFLGFAQFGHIRGVYEKEGLVKINTERRSSSVDDVEDVGWNAFH